ncbi:hypothetical protein DVH24_030594 [Malus domestica]|uniref:BRX domain-containing protein n=1 Tax=Malus domestica TaxID=3750 RepID=A0A498K1C4_MALDO|nr:hypothetical protein DVH24_030594 [Malus domestica]
MADLVSYGNANRDIDQAIIALKKGAQLLKYGRKGKPKFCPFRLSTDESTLIWISSSERSLKLASVTRIVPGQRTAVFQRYLRPEKDYLSFSLIYNNGKRSLDLICKDKVEAEVWIAGLKALLSSGRGGRSKIDGWSDGGLYLDDGKDLTSNSPSDSSASGARDSGSPEISQLDTKAAKQGKKADTFSLVRSAQAPSLLQLKEVVMSTAVDLRRTVPKPVLTPSGASSRSVSPFSRRPSPPRFATPVPTTSGLSFSKSIADSLKKTNELLNQEVLKLRSRVESLRQRCDRQELELQNSSKKVQEAMALAADESAKSKAAKEVIKSLTAQLKDLAERLSPGVYDTETIKQALLPNGLEPNGINYPDANEEQHSRSTSISSSYLISSLGIDSATTNGNHGPTLSPKGQLGTNETIVQHSRGPLTPNGMINSPDKLPNGGGSFETVGSSASETVDGRESGPFRDGENGARSMNSPSPANGNTVEAEWIEQYEPGVYITLVALRDGTRDLKRVRFSRRRFGEHQAQIWWSENREKVYEKYNVRGSDRSSVAGSAARRSDGALSPASSQQA